MSFAKLQRQIRLKLRSLADAIFHATVNRITLAPAAITERASGGGVRDKIALLIARDAC